MVVFLHFRLTIWIFPDPYWIFPDFSISSVPGSLGYDQAKFFFINTNQIPVVLSVWVLNYRHCFLISSVILSAGTLIGSLESPGQAMPKFLQLSTTESQLLVQQYRGAGVHDEMVLCRKFVDLTI